MFLEMDILSYFLNVDISNLMFNFAAENYTLWLILGKFSTMKC